MSKMAGTRKIRQDAFIRLCRDSGFRLPAVRAAALAGAMLKCSPIEIWMAFSSLNVMEAIAAGTHPAARAIALASEKEAGHVG